MYFNSLGPPSQNSTLTDRATRRLKMAFADSTSKSYELKFRLFVAFCCFASFNISNLSPLEILTFLEFLNFNNVTFSGIANHISAVKTSLSLYGIVTSSFSDPRIRLYNRAMMRHRPLQPSIKPVIDIPTLQLVAPQCNRMHMGHIFKAAILLAFFSFLRISNLVPHSITAYNPLKISHMVTLYLHHLVSTYSSSGPRHCKIKTRSKSSKSPPWADPPCAQWQRYWIGRLTTTIRLCFK